MAEQKLGEADPASWGGEFTTAFAEETKSWSESAVLLAAQLAAIKRAS